jgi:hypothetical protein
MTSYCYRRARFLTRPHRNRHPVAPVVADAGRPAGDRRHGRGGRGDDGHVSAAELAAVSLGTSVWSIVLVTVMGIMMAVNSVVAHEMGAGRFDKIRTRCANRCGWD